MPSVTAFPGYTLSNLGPLTTTFTAPASCATRPAQTILAYSVESMNLPNDLYMALSCDEFSYDGCLPSGSARDDYLNRSVLTPGIGKLLYHSPGLACPSDWATVGLASRDAEGTLTSSGAAFALPEATGEAVGSLAQLLGYNPDNNQILGALDPEETLVMCCPSSMTPDIYANCRRKLPPFPISTACPHIMQGDFPPPEQVETTFSVLGTTATGSVYSWERNAVTVRPETSTLRPEVVESLVGVEYSPMIILAHRGSATPTATPGTKTEGTGADSTGDESTAAPTNAAAGVLAPLWLSALGLTAGLAFVVAM